MASQNKIKLSFLFSYAYLRKGASLLLDVIQVLQNSTRIMIDSGAFTNFKANVKHMKAGKDYAQITLPEYIQACNQFRGCYQYIQLDVIGDPLATRVNYDKMRDAGLTPMPVFTGGAPYSDLEYYASQWRDICYGGIVTHSTDEHYVNIVRQGMTHAHPDTRFHLLGFARYPLVMSLPIQSFDSSSYAAGQQYGRLAVFTPQKGIFSFGKEEDPLSYVAWLHRCNITPEMLTKGAWRGQRGMPTMTTMYSHLDMMNYVLKTKGIYYFLAVPNMHLLEALLSVYASRTDKGYDYPAALERYNEIHDAHSKRTRVLDLVQEYVNG